MIIACPSCSARYVVDPQKIGPSGRTVKCAKCGHAWAQAAPEPDAGDLDDPGPAPTREDIAAAFDADGIGGNAPEPDDDLPDEDAPDGATMDFRSSFREEPAPVRNIAGDRRANLPAIRREPGKWPARIAWVVLFVVVGGVIGGTIGFRTQIVAAWPAAQKLYDVVGLSTEPEKPRLGVQSVKYDYVEQDGVNVLRIEGELINLSSVPGNVPNLHVKFFDAAGRTVKTWDFPPPERRMLPGEIVKFRTDVAAPPLTAKRIDVGLSKDGNSGS